MSDAEEMSKRAEFEATALPHMDQLYSTATYLCRDPDRAADLVQDAILRAYRFWHQFQAGTNCKSWLLTILYNTFRNQYRAQQRNPAAGVEYDEALHSSAKTPLQRPEANPAEIVVGESFDDEIAAALQTLSADFLEVVVLVDLQEMSYEETAEIIGRPVGTVRSRLSRARQQLQQQLAGYAREHGLAK